MGTAWAISVPIIFLTDILGYKISSAVTPRAPAPTDVTVTIIPKKSPNKIVKCPVLELFLMTLFLDLSMMIGWVKTAMAVKISAIPRHISIIFIVSGESRFICLRKKVVNIEAGILPSINFCTTFH